MLADEKSRLLEPSPASSFAINADEDDVKSQASSSSSSSSSSEDGPKEPLGQTLLVLMRLARPEIPQYIVAFLLVTAAGLAFQAANQQYGKLIDATQAPADQRNALLWQAVLHIGVLFGSFSLLDGLGNYVFDVNGEAFAARLREQIFQAAISQEIGFFDATKTGSLVSRLNTDTNEVQDSLSGQVNWFASNVAIAGVGVVLMFNLSWELTLVMFSLTPLSALFLFFQGSLVERLQKRCLDLLAKAGAAAEEIVSLIRTVRSFGREREEHRRYASIVQEQFRVARRKYLVESVFESLIDMCLFASFLAGLWYGATLIIDGKLSVGQMFEFVFLAMNTVFALLSLISILPEMAKMLGSAERIIAIIQRAPRMNIQGGVQGTPQQASGDIDFEDVHFCYPTRPDVVVLPSLSLHIPAGTRCAFVGHSGSGKSTLLKLVSRMYDVQGGAVLLAGTNVADYDPEWLRKQVGMVEQEPALFALSIMENIRYGNPGATDEEVIAAAQMANCDTFVSRLPKGYHTQCGEKGVTLSGGQKQLVAIARVLLKNPPILLLDEVSSALDGESEAIVQAALEKVEQGRTTLIVAHRLATVKDADMLVVMDRGRIVQTGTHTDLMQDKGGQYRAVMASQFALYQEAVDEQLVAASNGVGVGKGDDE